MAKFVVTIELKGQALTDGLTTEINRMLDALRADLRASDMIWDAEHIARQPKDRRPVIHILDYNGNTVGSATVTR